MEAQTPSKKINLKAGNKYSICTCGASKTIPFCDNSHRELTNCNFKSLKITPEEDITLKVSSKTWEKTN